MLHFLHSLFDPPSRQIGAVGSATINTAVDRVIDGTDPRLRAVPHYQRILARPVESALEYIAANADIFPPAITFDRRRFSADPRLRAMFVGPNHLLEVLSSSPEVRGYLKENRSTTPPELFAALRVERTEKRVFGMALDGGRVLRDVPQTMVNFHNHRVAFPATSEAETLLQVQARAFDYLIEVAKTHLDAMRARREQLERQYRQLCLGRSPVPGRAGRGAAGLSAGIIRSPHDPADARRLQSVEAELGRLRALAGTLGEQLALVANIVREPHGYLRFERVGMTLDRMNTKVSKNLRKSADDMTFNDILIDGQRRITLELIRFPSGELLPPTDLVANAERALQRAI
ncbi:MAG: hypothetical protein JZU52_04390 [Lamprocystis purpurea]|nr:hypothetical protein [Lamprocystis purpurea]